MGPYEMETTGGRQVGLDARGPRLVKSSSNILLRQLNAGDQALIEPHVSQLSMSRGTWLSERDQPIETVYFPEASAFALVEEIHAHKFAEIAIVGREGMVGWQCMLGHERTTHAIVCHSNGTMLSLPVTRLQEVMKRSASLSVALLSFINTIIMQMARAIASHMQDRLDQRLARWLLMWHDRVGGDILLVQHDEIADRLNVRRASVTDSLHVLEGEQLIRCRRGRIIIRDRYALEKLAGGSYGATEAHYRSLIGPFGKSEPVH